MTQWTAPENAWQRPLLRVSDADREQAAALLREHWLAGRLDAGEFDDRSTEVWGARTERDLAHALRELPATHRAAPRPASAAPAAVASLVLGVGGGGLLLMSFGLLAFLVLPVTATAWWLGARARHRPGLGRGMATAGMVLGLLGTVLSLLFLVAWAVFFL